MDSRNIGSSRFSPFLEEIGVSRSSVPTDIHAPQIPRLDVLALPRERKEPLSTVPGHPSLRCGNDCVSTFGGVLAFSSDLFVSLDACFQPPRGSNSAPLPDREFEISAGSDPLTVPSLGRARNTTQGRCRSPVPTLGFPFRPDSSGADSKTAAHSAARPGNRRPRQSRFRLSPSRFSVRYRIPKRETMVLVKGSRPACLGPLLRPAAPYGTAGSQIESGVRFSPLPTGCWPLRVTSRIRWFSVPSRRIG